MSGGAGGVHVLFHGVGVPRRELEPGEAEYWVDEARFEVLLDVLAAVPDLTLSFDDSNSSDLQVAVPALQARGLTATFYVLAGRMGHAGSLDAADVAAVRAEGMEIGTHGMHHVPWRHLSAGAAVEELVVARELIEQAAGCAVDKAALPLGRYDREALRRLRQLGYAEVCTSDRRRTAPAAFLQHRFTVRRTDTPQSILAEFERATTTRQRAVDAVKGAVKRLR